MTTPLPQNPYATTEAPAGENTLARASLILAIVLVVVGIVLQVVSRIAPLLMVELDWSAAQLGVLFAVFSFVELILGVFALVLGLLGARRPGRTLEAGIGIGVGGLTAITMLVSLVSTPLLGVLL